MNDALQLVRVLMGLLELAQQAGVDVSRVVEAQKRAKEEGRDLTDEELSEFRASAQSSIDAARDA